MYGFNTPPPPFMPWYPPPAQGNTNPADQIAGWITSLEALKKHFKEEKKDDLKPKKGDQPSILAVALFMLLVSPVSGPVMYYFFRLSIGMLHQ